MSPNRCPTTPARLSAGKLGVRHSPYPSRHSSTSKSSDYTGVSKPLLKKSSRTSSGASLQPTFSMIEEFEVEGLLGSGVSGQESVQSLSRASSISPSQESLSYYPPPTSSIDHLRGYRQASARPLTREWSTATAATVLELPNGPGWEHPSCGVLGSFSGSSSESSISEEKVDEMSWVHATPNLKTIPHRFAAFRSFGDESETDSDNVSMEEIAIRVPLPTPLNIQDSTDTLSSSSSSSPTTDGLPTPAESPARQRIWEVRPEDYVPRPAGMPARTVASVLEIGMQWERAHDAETPRSKDEKRAIGAVGRIRRIYGDAQYMN
ncbi:hypothetical protein FRC08_008900 [Ceratobasidium sp. 394]|nr:hypothetical protein FRC08_008900 [Ceratobasidium sp. 394]KAG9097697.1 hypothetical protein FS749_005732 [Ceratobasidium sp. UAMH 11750]